MTSRAQHDLATALAQLTAAELIFSRGIPPESSYIFKHALVQDAAYESLLRSHRQVLHGRIADVVTSHFPELAETQPELVAHHLASAGRKTEAVACLIRAAERAIERSAISEALDLLNRALVLHSTLPESGQDKHLSLELELLLARALITSRGYAAPETQAALLRAKSLLDNRTRVADRLTLLYGLWASYYVAGDVARQHEAAAEFTAEAARRGERIALCIANRSLGATHFVSGDFLSAHRHLARAQELYDPDAPKKVRYHFGQEVGITVLNYSCLALWHLGRLDEAERAARDSIRQAKALSHSLTLFNALAHGSGMMGMFRRDPADVLSNSGIVIHLAEEHGLPFWAAGGQVMRGWAVSRQGNPSEGLVEMAQGISEWRQTGSRLWLTFFLTMEAEILAECGRPDEALVQLGDAMVVAHETGENWAVPEVLRVRSAVLRRLCPSGNETDIEALLRESITMAHNQGGQSWRLRSTCDLARLLRDRGEANEGLQLLKSAYEDFGGHYNEPDHRAARELIENLANEE